MSSISIEQEWLLTAINELETGGSITIPVPSKLDMTQMKNRLRRERDALKLVDPVEASRITILTSDEKGKFWVILKKTPLTLRVAYKRDKDGNVSKIEIREDRTRVISLMLKDGLSLEQAQESLGELTEEEEALFLPHGG